jgi:Predicted oxidoreductases (related to aryl-alcohol dehydrogenases)
MKCKAAIEAEIFDYIQIPTSIIDTSIYSNYIKDQSKKVKFVARSIFLQGSIFNKNKIINKIIDGEMLLEAIKSIEFLAKQNNLTLASLALGFVGSLKNIDHIIMGSLSLNNMKKNIALLNLSLPQDLIEKILKISNKTASWKNPQNWGY